MGTDSKSKNIELTVYSVLLLQGVYSQFFQAIAIRELIARFSGAEATIALAFSSVLLWTALGCACAAKLEKTFDAYFKPIVAGLCVFSAVSAVSAFAFIALAPPFFGGGNIVFSLNEMAAFCFIAPLPFGMVNGAIFGVLTVASKKKDAGTCYSIDSLGNTIGGLAFSLIFASLAPPLAILGAFGIFLPLAGMVIIIRSELPAKTRAVLCLVALCVLAALSVGIFGDRAASFVKWRKLLDGYEYKRSIETPQGRVDFLRKGEAKQTAIYKNGALLANIPSDYAILFPTAVFAALQPDRKDLKILLIASPFSSLPRAFLQLPMVESVALLCPDKNLVKAARGMNILPETSAAFETIIEAPRAYLESQPEKNASFDLICLFDTAPDTIASNRYYTEQFYRQIASHLRRDGVFVTSMRSNNGLSGGSAKKFYATIIKTLRKVFSNIAIAPGENKLLAAGNCPGVTANFAEIDKRQSKFMRGFRQFPEGMMPVVFSQSEQKRESAEIESCIDNASVNSDLRPLLPFLYLGYYSRILSGDAETPNILMRLLEWFYKGWSIVLAAILSIYLVARFIYSRKMQTRLMFASFENGFYAMGVELLLLFMYQSCCGALYRDLAAAVGVFIGGAAIGAWRKRERTFRNLVLIAALCVPFALIAALHMPQLWARIYIFAMLALAGFSVGAAYDEFNRRSSVKSGTGLWAWEMTGGAAGIIFIILFLLPAGGFIPCAALLAFSRLALMLFGKKTPFPYSRK